MIASEYIYDDKGNQVFEDGYPAVTRSNFISAACAACNLKQTHKRKDLDVFMHNNGGYDMHLFLKDIDPSKYKNTFIFSKIKSQ